MQIPKDMNFSMEPEYGLRAVCAGGPEACGMNAVPKQILQPFVDEKRSMHTVPLLSMQLCSTKPIILGS